MSDIMIITDRMNKNMQKEKTNRIFEGESKDKNFEGKYGIHSPNGGIFQNKKKGILPIL